MVYATYSQDGQAEQYACAQFIAAYDKLDGAHPRMVHKTIATQT